MIFGRGQIGVFRQNELFHVIQHGKTHGNHHGNLGKMKKLEKWSTLLAPHKAYLRHKADGIRQQGEQTGSADIKYPLEQKLLT